jgi:hypothetical protein
MRYLTILFLIVTFLWWILLLVSVFVSPPGMHSRGSGFFDFAYTCLTLGNLLVVTIFFVVPAKGLRITTAIIALFLAVDMILILAVPRLRLEEGWVGIASVVWALVMSIWCIATDRVVAYGKREEEERLTGREESRRTLKEWLAVLAAVVLTVVFIVIVVLMTATLSIRSIDAGLKMYGERILVDGDKYAVHLACVGNKNTTSGDKVTTVLLEAGENPLEYDLEHWAYAAYKNETIDRYCYWVSAPPPFPPPNHTNPPRTAPATPGPTTRPPRTPPACPPTRFPKRLPAPARKAPGSSCPQAQAASSRASSARAT